MGSVYRAIKMSVALLGFIYMVACGGSTTPTETEDSGSGCGAIELNDAGKTIVLPAPCTIAPDEDACSDRPCTANGSECCPEYQCELTPNGGGLCVPSEPDH